MTRNLFPTLRASLTSQASNHSNIRAASFAVMKANGSAKKATMKPKLMLGCCVRGKTVHLQSCAGPRHSIQSCVRLSCLQKRK